MSSSLVRCCGATLLAGLLFTALARAGGPPWPAGPGGSCSGCGDSAYRVCKKSNYKPPSYHAGVPFGYYPTSWSRWPAPPRSAGEPPPAPEPLPAPSPYRPDVEPLPHPRPLDMTRLGDASGLPRLQPAGDPTRR